MGHIAKTAAIVVGVLFLAHMLGIDASITGGEAFGVKKPKPAGG
jgi:hypothetical protein